MQGKKVVGHSMRHSLSSQARTLFDENQLSFQTGVVCKGDVFVTSSFLNYGTETDCYRPFFVLAGRLLTVRGDFPDGVKEVSFQEVDTPEVRMEYELTNQQIADMYARNVFPELEDAKLFVVNKQNHNISRPEAVSTPDIMNNNMYSDLPLTCSVLMVKNTEVPILFIQPENQFNISLTAESSGYQLDSYMESFVPEIVLQDENQRDNITDLRKSLEKVAVVQEPVVRPEDVAEIGNPVVKDIFNVTKPRVDEHVEADEAYIRQVKEVVAEDEVLAAGYTSPFEQMMLEDIGMKLDDASAEPTDIDAILYDMPELSSSTPLSIEEVIARRKKKQRASVRQLQSANVADNSEKGMPKNLDLIQKNSHEDKSLGE